MQKYKKRWGLVQKKVFCLQDRYENRWGLCKHYTYVTYIKCTPLPKDITRVISRSRDRLLEIGSSRQLSQLRYSPDK